jgi:hypothetical protein
MTSECRHRLEPAGIVEVLARLAERSLQQERAVDDRHDPVVELDLKPVAVKRFDCDHSEHRGDITEARSSKATQLR